ncbi:hypothetical protein BJ138DRAFT_1065976 [Hygrophoropsis aurantiaca]|uniref:Uncharacterized protein n=1 Tax=Hygrophoropsis aurantiaca TaxID=72124 RepID=A0ACB8AA00_9AGAM|nr:hypothetical protein BJ138DRAFT_1065976 [Hygrophoropsis aurantiaca]
MAKSSHDKNSLCIRLTESMVFLRTSDPTGRHAEDGSSTSPAMVRGLLTLNISKPTRISSIELELQGRATTSWPEGVGARRIEVTEQHKVYSASTVFFRASAHPSVRRTASVGPGLSLLHDNDDYNTPLERSPIATPNNEPEEYFVPPRSASVAPQRAETGRISRHVSCDASSSRFLPEEDGQFEPTPPYSPPSADQRPVISHSASGSTVDSGSNRLEDSPAQTLEDLRRALRNNLEHAQPSPSSSRRSSVLPNQAIAGSSASSICSPALSRRPSIEDVPEDEPIPQITRLASRTRSDITSHSKDHDDHRGRKHARFTFAAVASALDVMKNRVRSQSPRTASERRHASEYARDGHHEADRGRKLDKGKGKASEEQAKGLGLGRLLHHDGDEHKDSGEGWKEFKKGTYTYPISFTIPNNSPPTIEADHGSMTWRLKAEVHRPGAFTSKLTATREVLVVASPGEEDTEDTDNIIVERQWDSQLQYLISVSGRSFPIGGVMPITLTIMPLAKAKVHRISVFLDERVDYYTKLRRIARSQPVHRVPLLTLRAGGDASPQESQAILPITSDDPQAFRKSPFYRLIGPDDDESEMASSLMGPGPWTIRHDLRLPESCGMLNFSNRNKKSNILVSHVLKIVFRVERGDDQMMDPKTKKRKLFDIVVQTPVHILSCRCAPQWMSLPRYCEVLDRDLVDKQKACPCDFRKLRGTHSNLDEAGESLDRVVSSDSAASSAENQTSVNPLTMPSLRAGNAVMSLSNQYERLISGQESEAGEAPPSYDSIARVPQRVQQEHGQRGKD